MVKISHPPYSLYLAPCDTLLFLKVVTALKGRRLQDVDIKMKITTKLNAVTPDASVTVLCNLSKDVKTVLQSRENNLNEKRTGFPLTYVLSQRKHYLSKSYS